MSLSDKLTDKIVTEWHGFVTFPKARDVAVWEETARDVGEGNDGAET